MFNMTLPASAQQFNWTQYLNDLTFIQQYLGSNITGIASLSQLLGGPMMWVEQLQQQFMHMMSGNNTTVIQTYVSIVVVRMRLNVFSE